MHGPTRSRPEALNYCGVSERARSRRVNMQYNVVYISFSHLRTMRPGAYARSVAHASNAYSTRVCHIEHRDGGHMAHAI